MTLSSIFSVNMNYFIIFTLISAVTCATLKQESKWEQFKLKFKKNFRSLTHENERKAIFMSTLKAIEGKYLTQKYIV